MLFVEVSQFRIVGGLAETKAVDLEVMGMNEIFSNETG